MKVRTVAVVMTAVAAVVVAVAAAVDGTRRPPLELPAASAFPAGPCREMADEVLALGRFTYEHEGAERLPADAYPFLRQRAERLAAVRGTVAGPAQAGDPLQEGGSLRGGSPPSGSPPSGSPTGGAPTRGAVTGGGTPAAAPGPATASGTPVDAAPSSATPSIAAPPVAAAPGSGAPAAASDPLPDPLEQALSSRIDAVLAAIGFLRLRPGRAYDPVLLRDLEAARSDLQRACVSRRD